MNFLVCSNRNSNYIYILHTDTHRKIYGIIICVILVKSHLESICQINICIYIYVLYIKIYITEKRIKIHNNRIKFLDLFAVYCMKNRNYRSFKYNFCYRQCLENHHAHTRTFLLNIPK